MRHLNRFDRARFRRLGTGTVAFLNPIVPGVSSVVAGRPERKLARRQPALLPQGGRP